MSTNSLLVSVGLALGTRAKTTTRAVPSSNPASDNIFVDRCVSINSYSDERYEPFNHFYISGWIRAVSRLNLVLPHKFTTGGSDSNHRLRPDPATHIARLIQGSSNASELSKSESLSYSVYDKCLISRPEPTCALFKRLSLISMCVTRPDRR